MARIARVSTPGYLVHVICRFVDREWFFASDGERARYLSLLGRALQKSDWRCLAYCLIGVGDGVNFDNFSGRPDGVGDGVNFDNFSGRPPIALGPWPESPD